MTAPASSDPATSNSESLSAELTIPKTTWIVFHEGGIERSVFQNLMNTDTAAAYLDPNAPSCRLLTEVLVNLPTMEQTKFFPPPANQQDRYTNTPQNTSAPNREPNTAMTSSAVEQQTKSFLLTIHNEPINPTTESLLFNGMDMAHRPYASCVAPTPTAPPNESALFQHPTNPASVHQAPWVSPAHQAPPAPTYPRRNNLASAQLATAHQSPSGPFSAHPSVAGLKATNLTPPLWSASDVKKMGDKCLALLVMPKFTGEHPSPPPYSPPRPTNITTKSIGTSRQPQNNFYPTLTPSAESLFHGREVHDAMQRPKLPDLPRPKPEDPLQPAPPHPAARTLTVAISGSSTQNLHGDHVQDATPKIPPAPPTAIRRRTGRKRGKCEGPDTSVAFLYFFGFLVFALGLATLVLGAVAYFDEEKLVPLVKLDSSRELRDLKMLGLLKSSSVLLTVTGAAVLFLGFLGCCGVLVRSKAMLGAFSFLVLILVLVQLGLGTVALVKRQWVQWKVERALVDGMKTSYDGSANSNSTFSHALDLVQVSLGCCGVTGVRDFVNTPWFARRPQPNITVPVTCCQVADHPLPSVTTDTQPDGATLINASCPFQSPGKDNPNTATPCLEKMKEVVDRCLVPIVCWVATVLVVEIVALFSAVVVVSKMWRQDWGATR